MWAPGSTVFSNVFIPMRQGSAVTPGYRWETEAQRYYFPDFYISVQSLIQNVLSMLMPKLH